MNDFITYQVGQNALLHLIGVSHFVESYYQALKRLSPSDDVKSWIERHLENTQAFKNKSKCYLKSATQKPNLYFKTINSINFLWLELKCLFHNGEDHKIFEDCLKLNSRFLNQVNKEIKSGIHSKEVYAVLDELKCKLYRLEHEAYLCKLKVS